MVLFPTLSVFFPGIPRLGVDHVVSSRRDFRIRARSGVRGGLAVSQGIRPWADVYRLVIVAIAGVTGLTLMQNPGGPAQNPVLGNVLELCAMVSAAANMLIVKQLSRRYNPWTSDRHADSGRFYIFPARLVLLVARGLVGLEYKPHPVHAVPGVVCHSWSVRPV